MHWLHSSLSHVPGLKTIISIDFHCCLSVRFSVTIVIFHIVISIYLVYFRIKILIFLTLHYILCLLNWVYYFSSKFSDFCISIFLYSCINIDILKCFIFLETSSWMCFLIHTITDKHSYKRHFLYCFLLFFIFHK